MAATKSGEGVNEVKRTTLVKVGILFMVIGIVGSLALYGIRESNKPIKVTSSLGSGYMGGWSTDTVDMLNMFIVVGVADAVAGCVMLVAGLAKKEGT